MPTIDNTPFARTPVAGDGSVVHDMRSEGTVEHGVHEGSPRG